MRLEYRTLGNTGIRVSAIAFGCGPVSGWMAELAPAEQCLLVRRAIDAGINWFDTAAGYGDGLSERSLGRALARLGWPAGIHIATKVRYPAESLDRIRDYTRLSVAGSLERLGLERVTLLQLHNSVTANRGEEPTSITPQDVLGRGGVLEAFRELQAEGRVLHIGLTGMGQPAALGQVVEAGVFAAMQVPYNLLNPSAGQLMPPDFTEIDYGNIIAACAERGMGVFAIRVFAGGALLGNPPSAYTKKTLFFPLSLYERDRRRAETLAGLLGAGLAAGAVRFPLEDSRVTSAIIGFRNAAQLDKAVGALGGPPLPGVVQAAVKRGVPPP